PRLLGGGGSPTPLAYRRGRALDDGTAPAAAGAAQDEARVRESGAGWNRDRLLLAVPRSHPRAFDRAPAPARPLPGLAGHLEPGAPGGGHESLRRLPRHLGDDVLGDRATVPHAESAARPVAAVRPVASPRWRRRHRAAARRARAPGATAAATVAGRRTGT